VHLRADDRRLRRPPEAGAHLEPDDADREFADTAGAEDALQAAGAEGWTAVSMTRDWSRVFPA
jgi:hypothetical protein